MEKAIHSIVTEKMREFKKLRRFYRALERQHQQMPIADYNRMLELDEWLADNNPNWHQNYPDLEPHDILKE